MRLLFALLALLLLAVPTQAMVIRVGSGAAAAPPPPPASCPANTICSQIHNAPGWQASHVYTAATPPVRVNSGLGWTPGSPGSYTPGLLVRNYQLTSAGTCTSASSGGPTGTGNAIADGTCVWKYTSDVDYVTFSGWIYDGPAWVSGTTYSHGFYVTSDTPLRSYLQTTNNGCTSTVAPTGTAATITTGDGCVWSYNADIVYSSQASYIPNIVLTGAPGTYFIVFTLAANYEAQLWNDQEYVSGVNGEAHPITTGGYKSGAGNAGDTGESVFNYCQNNVGHVCFYIDITAAPGESFKDTITPSVALGGYNIANGVGMRAAGGGIFGSHGGFKVLDTFVRVHGLQFRGLDSDTTNGGTAFDGLGGCYSVIYDNIFQGGTISGNGVTFTFDCRMTFADNVIVVGGSTGAFTKYDAIYLNNTIICNNPSQTNSAGILSYFNNYGASGTTIQNTDIFGCTHSVAHLTANGAAFWLADSQHNGTSGPSADSTSVSYSIPPYAGAQTYTADPMPGATYGLSGASAFVNAASDWRLTSGSSLAGIGAPFGNFDWVRNCTQGAGCEQSKTYNFDTPDIIGTARPGSTGYDIGAWQTP